MICYTLVVVNVGVQFDIPTFEYDHTYFDTFNYHVVLDNDMEHASWIHAR